MEHKNPTPAYILSDEPAGRNAQFGFEGYSKTIADLIAYKRNLTPLVIGIYGPWGSGKTTLMQSVRDKLGNYAQDDTFRICKTVWYQAWKYAEEEAILAGLIEEVFKTMQADGIHGWFKAEFGKFASRLNKKKIVGKVGALLTGGTLDISEFFSELKYKEKLGFLNTFQDFFDRALAAYLSRPGFKTENGLDDQEGVLVIFIDDLDRCPQSNILKVLETIKLFLDKRGCIFVIGADQAIIESAIFQRYPDRMQAEKFLEKVVHVAFELPRIPEEDICKFIENADPASPILRFKEFIPVVTKILGHNPRSIKRFVSNLCLRHCLANNINLELEPESDALIRWTLMEYTYVGLVKLIKENPQYLQKMMEVVEKLEAMGIQSGEWNLTQANLDKANVPEPLVEFIKDRRAVDLVKGFPTNPSLIQTLISLSSATKIGKEEKEKTHVTVSRFSDKMVKIPKGLFLYGDENKPLILEKELLIDVYPVTNQDFQRFVEAGGYENKIYWDPTGWAWRENNRISCPEFFFNKKFNEPDCPVVGVSYFEAEAFANWAGKRLQTELEWEKAARGEEGNVFPWGNNFEIEKCNIAESGIDKTTPVTKYFDGISPYGCFDMAGNVWEWTNSWWDSSEESRVLRGGSWYYGSSESRCSYRGGNKPTTRYDDIGFRCVKDAH